MALETYKAKRNFQETPEPAGKVGKASGRAPIFVVQEHHASHLHYDFRIEADGVLKSWAVPKEPSRDPSQKRLAVQVEDHPLDYASFEGTIPEHHYGAGEVFIWDHGTYDNLLETKAVPQTVSEGLAAGRVEIDLHGEKLRGRYALIRMQGRGGSPTRRGGKVNWLLIKMKDEFAQADTATATAPRTTGKAKKTTKSTRPAQAAEPKASSPKATPARRAKAPKTFDAFTHTDKVMFPEAGLTKGDVLAFYDKVADRLIPYLRNRPITLERLPEGLAGPRAPHFWQKDTPKSYPDWIPRVALENERGKVVHYALVNDRATLLYLVNQGTITFHPWFSRIKNLDRPDFVLFDLDPGQVGMPGAVEVARRLREVLVDAGAEPVVKTSGKRGLHVLVPWTRRGGFDASRAWAEQVATEVAGSRPDLATTEIRKARRGQAVYIDVMQNARGHHAVPPYVLRPTPQATVSTPLTWRELTPDLDPTAFTLKTIFRRLARQKADPLGTQLVKSR